MYMTTQHIHKYFILVSKTIHSNHFVKFSSSMYNKITPNFIYYFYFYQQHANKIGYIIPTIYNFNVACTNL